MWRENLFFIFASLGLVRAKVQYFGIAIAGIDFGCDIDGSCPVDSGDFPLSGYGGADGEGQMKHFVEDNGLNMFRLPVSWQFLLNGQPAGSQLDQNALAKYDKLMQACLGTGAHCMIDVHNFARFDDGIIGQGGPSNDDFADLWAQLAKPYAKENKVVFGLMNEPHDLDVNLWADSCQAAVTSIRKAGATDQMILLPGTNFASAATLVSDGSAEALLKVKNPDGSTDGLLLDIHKYLDHNNSGQYEECTLDNVEAFNELAKFLRKEKRKGMISETGASSDKSCFTAFCAQNKAINDNSDVFIGLVVWSAGSFPESYVLNLTPSKQGDSWVNVDLFEKCALAPWKNSKSPAASSSSASTTSSKTTTANSSTHSSSTTRPSKTTEETTGTVKPTDIVAGVASSPTNDPSSGTSVRPVVTFMSLVLAGIVLLLVG